MKQTNKTLQNWESLELGTFVDLSDEKYVPNTAENIPCIELECIEQETGLLFKTISSKDLNSTKNKFYKNNVLFGKLRPYLKKYYLATFDGVCSSEIWVLIANNKVCLNKYLFYLVQTQRFLYYTNKSSGSKMPRADWNVVSQSTFLLPPIKEQEKIVEILELWDKAIETTKKLIEQKKLQKKYLMQKLLTGKIRLKGFKTEWKEVTINDVLLERKIYSEKGKEYPHISLTKEGVVPKTERYERDFLVKDKNKEYKITKLNDICYNPANLKFGVIAKNSYGNGIFSPIYITYEIKKNVNIDFISYYVVQPFFINKARRFEEGTVYERMAVNPEDFVKVKIKIPTDLKEQEEIANILLTADNQINLLEQKLSKLELQKKGLMQKLLTGQIRVC